MTSRTASPMQASRRATRLALVGALAIGLTATLALPAGEASAADEYGYPTWAEVEAARASESAKSEQISRIRDLIAQLEQAQVEAENTAQIRANEAQAASEAYNEAIAVADQLQAQADEASQTAAESSQAASQMAAQLARTGGAGDMSAELFANPGSADDWLYRLGLADRVASSASAMYEQAQQDANSAQALQDQAAVAREELRELKEAADAAAQAAQQAAQAAAAAVEESEQHRVELQTQLSVLVEDRRATEADYSAGQRYREELARQERERQERERQERERAYQEWLASQRPPASGGGGGGAGGGGGGGGGVSNSGWTAPHYGRFTSGFGWRYDPVGTLGYKLHGGIDIAAGCGTPIYAASAGTVTFNGRELYGAYMLSISHGGGVRTDYVHMNQPALPGYGSYVQAGQVIGYEGMTGHATGCHLHFQVSVNGQLVDGRAFLAARGVYL